MPNRKNTTNSKLCNYQLASYSYREAKANNCPIQMPKIASNESEINLVTWRNQYVDNRNVKYCRPGSLDCNIRVVVTEKDGEVEKDLRPFKESNECRGACTVRTDLKRYLDRLYRSN